MKRHVLTVILLLILTSLLVGYASNENNDCSVTVNVFDETQAGGVIKAGTYTQDINEKETESTDVVKRLTINNDLIDCWNNMKETVSKPGSYVTFGSYPQTIEGDMQPIEWVVLNYDESDNKLLLISRYALDYRCYMYESKSQGRVEWGNSTLRDWLNNVFFQKAFSKAEQSAILLTPMKNNDSTGEENETDNKIFVLDTSEAQYYFDSNKDRLSELTPYARMSSKRRDGSNGSTIKVWLRSPGAVVHSDGSCKKTKVSNWCYVRPALWVDLGSELFLKDDEKRMAAVEAKIEPFRHVGSYVAFGSYNQYNIAAKGKEAIEWLVLDYDADNHRSLLISRYGLDSEPYNTEIAYVTWETCTLRTWLNDSFLNTAFSEIEQSAIMTTAVDNSSIQGYGERNVDGGSNTQDRIFLLSYREAFVDYFSSDGARQVKPTKYAEDKGVNANSYKDGSCWWWLRSPGFFSNNAAAHVWDDGNRGNAEVHSKNGAVRPALWIDLDSDYFLNDDKKTMTAEEEEKIKPFRRAGGFVVLGRYEQDNDTMNGKEAIEWLVLDYDAPNRRSLLISRYCLDAKPYNTEKLISKAATWETSTIRRWLNDEFLNTAFNASEQKAILLVNVDNSKSQGYSRVNISGGNNTQDKIFLLSCKQALVDYNSEFMLIASPTEYAVARGAYEQYGGCWWWLRSPGNSEENIASVVPSGFGYYHSEDDVEGSVRPALWIDLDQFSTGF